MIPTPNREERPGYHQTPQVGAEVKCLVCALVKPWGIWDGSTGVAVCVECRDKARHPEAGRDSAAQEAEAREFAMAKALANEQLSHETTIRHAEAKLKEAALTIEAADRLATAGKACIRGCDDNANGFRVNLQMANFKALRAALDHFLSLRGKG